MFEIERPNRNCLEFRKSNGQTNMTNSLRCLVVCVLGFCSGLVHSQQSQSLSVPADSPRWDLQQQAKVTEYLGRKCLMMNGGAAELKDFEMRDGVLDVDVATAPKRGFFGFDFRIDKDEVNYEEIYLRPHKSGLPDAIQYTSVLNTGRNWQIYNGPGFTAAVDIPKEEWFHLRLELTGAQAKLYVRDMDQPALVMNDLKSGVQKGKVALFVLTGETCFSNFEVRTTADALWERHLPSMPANTLAHWSISPSYDGLARNLEHSPSKSESDAIQWQDVEAEPPGFVVLYRYRQAPHPVVTFQGDFSKRLDPQPGMQVLYARTTINSDRDQVKKLEIGYSDDVSVFLNGQILYRGRSAQGFRDPGFLGIVNAENDTVYLPLKKGRNELMLAVSELGGGWGFICRLVELR
jgi:NADH:ubiquinone oxidoreductase subunit